MRVTIDRLVYGGDGEGHAEGMPHDDAREPVRLPFTLPGELVTINVTDSALEIIQASPDRVAPGCVHFGVCGGCQYQHMNDAAQVAAKTVILQDVLAAAGLKNLPEVQQHTAEPWGYRNRIRLRVAVVDGVLRVGYNRRGSFELLPIVECPIAAPLLLRAAMALLEAAAALPGWSQQLTAVELFANGDQSRLQMTLFVRSERSLVLGALCARLKTAVPELAGAGLTVVGPSGRREQPGATWGAAGLLYAAAGREYWVSRGSFFQVNRFLADTLVRLATGGRTGVLAWDLYAGVGLFTRALTESFGEVVGVETVAGDLAAALKGHDARAVAAASVEFLRQAVLERERPDLVVMDPPRAGVGAEVCALLGRIKPATVVYVSCDPETLAVDLRAMVDSGYTIQALHLVDLFPQTFHMESVVVLNR